MMDAVIRASFEGSFLVLIAWASLYLVRGLAPSHRAAIWLLVTLKFFISLSAFAIILPILPKGRELSDLAGRTTALYHRPSRPETPGAGIESHSTPTPDSFDPIQALAAIWVVGICSGTLLLVRDAFRVRRVVKRASLGDVRLREISAACSESLNVRTPTILVSSEISSPCAVGVLWPKILLPERSLHELSYLELGMAISHEIGHIKNSDLSLRWLPEALCLVYFFLPTSWIARREWLLSREAVCDQIAVNSTGASSKAYGELLLKFVRSRQPGQRAVGLSATTTFSNLKERLKMIENSRTTSRLPRLVPAGLLFVAIGSIVPWRVMAQGSQDPEVMKELRTQTQSRLKNAGLTTLMYCSDYDDTFPVFQSSPKIFKALSPYAKSDSIFQTLNPDGGRFLFNTALSGAWSKGIPAEKQGETVMIFDEKPWPDGKRVAAFVDDSSKVVSPEVWDTVKSSLKKTYLMPPKHSPKP